MAMSAFPDGKFLGVKHTHVASHVRLLNGLYFI